MKKHSPAASAAANPLTPSRWPAAPGPGLSDPAAGSQIQGTRCGFSGPRHVFLGTPFDQLTQDDVLAFLRAAKCDDPFRYIVTPNVDHVVRLNRNPELREAYDNAWLSLCDSKPISLLSRLFGFQLTHITGSDLTAIIAENFLSLEDKLTVVVADEGLAFDLRSKFPRLHVSSYSPPFRFESDPAAFAACVEFIVAHPARLILLAVGAPRSELLASAVANSGRGKGTALCIGAGLEFLVGRKRRAPKIFRSLSLEWVYRLASEPRRLWRRYLGAIAPLLGLVIREFFSRRTR